MSPGPTSDTILLGGIYSTTDTSQSSVTFEVYGVTVGTATGSQGSGGAAGKINFLPLGTETVHLVHGVGIIAFAASVTESVGNSFTQFELENQSTQAAYAVKPDATATDTVAGATVRLGEYTLMGNTIPNLFGGLLNS